MPIHVPQHIASPVVMPIQFMEQSTEPQLSVSEWITSSAIMMNDHLCTPKTTSSEVPPDSRAGKFFLGEFDASSPKGFSSWSGHLEVALPPAHHKQVLRISWEFKFAFLEK